MVSELFKERSLDAYLEYFNRDSKSFKITRTIYGIVLFFAFSLGFIIIGSYSLLIFTPLAFYLGYKIPYFVLMNQKKQEELKISFIFPQFLQTFIGLLSSSGNVYQTLKATIDYTNEPLKTELKKLVSKIEKDNNRESYIEFAEFIGTNEAYTIMDMIYQFSEFGIRKDTLNDFRDYIRGLDENKVNELIERKMMSSEKYGYIAIFISVILLIGYASAIFLYYMQDVMDALEFIM